jgi:hypothetical protein
MPIGGESLETLKRLQEEFQAELILSSSETTSILFVIL